MSKWTKEQHAAIYERGTNLLVAAGAGAGKTAVLVERIIGYIINDRVNIDELLVVTFTNAAAAEMRERIGATLAARLKDDPGDEHLTRQLALLGRATIMTIHSFCLEVLRQHFYLLDLDPAFRIADEHEAAMLKADVLEALMEQHYTDPDEPFLTLVEGFGGRHDDAGLFDLVLRLAEVAQSNPDPEEWLKELASPYRASGRSENIAVWQQEVLTNLRTMLDRAWSSLEQALEVACLTNGPEHYKEVLTAEIESVESAAAALQRSWDEARDAVNAVVFSRLPTKRTGDPGLREQAKTHRDRAKKIVLEKIGPVVSQSAEELEQGLCEAAPMVERLVDLVGEFLARYTRAKRERDLVDFNDLEHLCLTLLRGEGNEPSPVARELRAKFREVLADEYQDINAVQEALLRLVSRGGNTFMVGDVKQSIYRFRLADPTLFLGKYRTYHQQGGGKVVDLAHNFRSRASVLAGVNYLFRQIMSEEVGELTYDSAAELKAGAEYPPCDASCSGSVDVMLYSGKQSEDDEDDDLDTVSREGRAIARRIKSLVLNREFQVYDRDAGCYRSLEYRDIVVLLRTTRHWAEPFLEEFRKLCVPVYTETSTGYFAATEVATMLSLLKVIDNPYQDIPLAAVLRSPLADFSAEEMAEVRLLRPVGYYYNALRAAAQDEGPLGERALGFLRRLEHWRKLSRRGSLPELIWQVYRETGYYLLVGATPGGQQRQANLRALYDRACQYEQTAFRGLFRFLLFVERLQEQSGDLGTARSLGEKENVVRVMSIHKSKGLEFPVVFVGGLGKQFNLTDLKKPVLIHKDLGLGPYAVHLGRRNLYPTLPRLAIEHRLHREALSEELRILYVAMTRAREKLFLVGSVSNLEKRAQDWLDTAREGHARLPAAAMLSARCFLDWIGPVVLQETAHGFTVSTDVAVGPAPEAAPSPSTEPVELVQEDILKEAVAKRLGWAYPWSHSSRKSVKISVTELKRRQIQEELPGYRFLPLLRKDDQSPGQVEGPVSSAQVGTAAHLMLQHSDLSSALDEDYFEELGHLMVERKLLTEQEVQAIDKKMLESFFSREVGLRLLASPRVWRELPFSLRIPAEEVHGGQCEGEHVLVQGVIDCLFREGDELVLLDFKTDRVSQEGIEQLAANYRPQLALYRRAVEQLFRLPVKESYLCLLAARTERAVLE
jgi:ATP-dependent helicase/nuclease subunit A